MNAIIELDQDFAKDLLRFSLIEKFLLITHI